MKKLLSALFVAAATLLSGYDAQAAGTCTTFQGFPLNVNFGTGIGTGTGESTNCFGRKVQAAFNTINTPNGLAGLDANGRLPAAQLSSNAVALDNTGHVPAALLPSSVVTLDATGRLPGAQLPSIGAFSSLAITGAGSTGPVDGMTAGGVPLSSAIGLHSLTRAAISTSSPSALVQTIVTSGYANPNDRGAGCTYVRGTSNGPSAIQDALGNFWQLPFGKPYDVTCFGAQMNPTSVDDSAAVQAAITAASQYSGGGQVTIPAGGIKFCNINIPSNITLTGSGLNSTAVFASSANCTPFSANFGSTLSTGGGNITIERLAFYAFNGGRQTNGAFVFFSNCSNCRLTMFNMSGAYVGAQVNGANTVNVSIDHGRSDGAAAYHFVVSGGSDTYLDTLVTTAGSLSQAVCGLQITQSGGVWLSNSDFVSSGHGTCLQPTNGQSVSWMFFTNNALGDSGSGNGLLINPTGTGIIRGVSISNSWTSSNRGAGVVTQCASSGGNTGVVDGLRIAGHRSIDNGLDGFTFNCGSNIRLTSPVAQSNSNPALGGTSGASSGISFAAGLSHFSVVNGDFTQLYGDPVLQKYGVLVGAGASNYYTIRNNDGAGGTQSGTTVQDGGTGTSKFVDSNF